MTVVFLNWYLRVIPLLKISDMRIKTKKDLQLTYKQEFGIYAPESNYYNKETQDYMKWLEEKVIALDQNVYDLKLKMLRMIENPVNVY